MSTIPASSFLDYIQLADTWLLKDQDGNPSRQIDRRELELLSKAGNECSFGTGSRSKLRFVRLLVPLDVAVSMAAARSKPVVDAEDVEYMANVEIHNRRIPTVPFSRKITSFNEKTMRVHWRYEHKMRACLGL